MLGQSHVSFLRVSESHAAVVSHGGDETFATGNNDLSILCMGIRHVHTTNTSNVNSKKYHNTVDIILFHEDDFVLLKQITATRYPRRHVSGTRCGIRHVIKRGQRINQPCSSLQCRIVINTN